MTSVGHFQCYLSYCTSCIILLSPQMVELLYITNCYTKATWLNLLTFPDCFYTLFHFVICVSLLMLHYGIFQMLWF